MCASFNSVFLLSLIAAICTVEVASECVINVHAVCNNLCDLELRRTVVRTIQLESERADFFCIANLSHIEVRVNINQFSESLNTSIEFIEYIHSAIFSLMNT